jgi:hypothetical protein
MDYAFGERMYETIDELLKPFKKRILYWMWNRFLLWEKREFLKVEKEILWLNAHINEGTADNYFP